MTAGPRRKGTGGHGRRRLQGKGPTPPAHLRPGHPAKRRAAAADKRNTDKRTDGASRDGSPGRRPETPRDGAPPDGVAPGRGSRYAVPPRGDAVPAWGKPPDPDGPGSPRTSGSRIRGGRYAVPPRGDDPPGSPRTSGSRIRGGRYESDSGKTAAGRATPRGGRAAVSPGRPAGGAGRAADGPELVAGRNAVLESLRAAVPASALYVARRLETDDRVAEAIRIAADDGIPVVEAGRAELDRLTGGALHQGLALRVPPHAYAHPRDLTARAADAGVAPLIVALDAVTDPRNLGAVARSAAAFGAHGLVIPARRSAGVTASAWKVSAGAFAHLPVARAANLVRTLADYQQAGLFVAGLDARGSTDVADMEVADGPLVLVVGSEGRGLSRLTAERCDLLVRIPVASLTESLNAGVAAGIALYEVACKRDRS
jgi:23S rRNA (guanosine2251-2'-O)-methyltransferase